MQAERRYGKRLTSQLFNLSLSVVAAALLSTALAAQAPSFFLTIDAPDAGTGTNQGTTATAINSVGDIAGRYVDSNGLLHGFVRSQSTGVITEFDPPNSIDTFVTGINKGGRIVGFSGRTGSAGSHEAGFLRMPDGRMFPVNVPGAVDTEPQAINDVGQIAGWYDDASGTHGFRESGGVYTTFDAPGTNTIVTGMNVFGDITGYYTAGGVTHGFLRDAGGTITSFDVPGSTGTFPAGIGSLSPITGTYGDSSNLAHGFEWDSVNGAKTFDCPDFDQTFAVATSPNGVVVGQCDKGANFKGFRRDKNGNVVPFTIPVPNKGVSPMAINGWGSGGIVGFYVDLNGVSHGFRR